MDQQWCDGAWVHSVMFSDSQGRKPCKVGLTIDKDDYILVLGAGRWGLLFAASACCGHRTGFDDPGLIVQGFCSRVLASCMRKAGTRNR
jgi:hypothetical protein